MRIQLQNDQQAADAPLPSWNGQVQLWAAVVWGFMLAGFGVAAPLWLALACLAVAGAADTVSVVSRGAMVQLVTPDSHRGRVSAVDHVVGVAGPRPELRCR